MASLRRAKEEEKHGEQIEYESMVYFVLHKKYNAIKIGFSSDVDDRLSSIRMACPVYNAIKLLFWFEGGSKEEAEFHRRFRLYRLDGEWFELEGELRVFVEECLVTVTTQLNGLRSPLW